MQIAPLVQQHRSVLDTLHEEVLVIAADGTLSAANPLAARRLGLTKTAQPLPIAQVWPALAESSFPGARSSADLLPPLRGTPVMVSSMPCGAGRVVTFRDRAEFTRVAEELTRSRELTDLGRAQSHEFMNRLHTVADLIYLGHGQEAPALISAQTEQTSNVQELISAVEVPAVAALIIGKFARAHEKRVQLIVEPGSALSAAWGEIASDVLVPVLGNLLENAFEAAQEGRPLGEGQVRLMVGEDPQGLELEVRGKGPSVPEPVLAQRAGERVSSRGVKIKATDYRSSSARSRPWAAPSRICGAASRPSSVSGRAGCQETPMTYSVMLIEDDAQVAQINAGLIAELPEYQVVAVHERAAKALELVRLSSPDLLFLDVFLMDGDGLQVLHDLRAEQLPVEVIMMTAANDARTVEQALHAGALDFLIKPFSPDRLRASLGRFAERMSTQETQRDFSQRKLDALLGILPGEYLPKGIDQETLGKCGERCARWECRRRRRTSASTWA